MILSLIHICLMLGVNEYLRRKNNVANIIHLHFTCANSLLHNIVLYYKNKPETILENEKIKIYWKREIFTDITTPANRPDTTILDKRKKGLLLIDISVSYNCRSVFYENVKKY